MNCLLSGAIVRIGGVQKRADGVAGTKYSSILKNAYSSTVFTASLTFQSI